MGAETVPKAHLDTRSCTASHGPPRSMCGSSWRRMLSSTSPGGGVGWGQGGGGGEHQGPGSAQFPAAPPCSPLPVRPCSLQGLAPSRRETASIRLTPSSGPGAPALPLYSQEKVPKYHPHKSNEPWLVRRWTGDIISIPRGAHFSLRETASTAEMESCPLGLTETGD